VTASLPGTDLRWLGERHREIIQALQNRDPERAAAALRQHALEAAGLIEDSLDGEAAGSDGGRQ